MLLDEEAEFKVVPGQLRRPLTATLQAPEALVVLDSFRASERALYFRLTVMATGAAHPPEINRRSGIPEPGPAVSEAQLTIWMEYADGTTGTVDILAGDRRSLDGVYRGDFDLRVGLPQGGSGIALRARWGLHTEEELILRVDPSDLRDAQSGSSLLF